MRFTLLTAFIFTIAISGYGQAEQTKNGTTQPEVSAQKQSNTPSETIQNDSPDSRALPGYVRPNKKERFNRYVNSVVGPFALAKYTATAGITTWRNTPNEWGDKWDGFGRRFASNLGKSAIKNTTTYALDEALKVDSRFYRSRNRSVSARLRNSVFSVVTARDTKGKRVIGVPRIAGSFLSGVVASEAWYPSRYNYTHGLKSGVISLGFTVGFNAIREFAWKK